VAESGSALGKGELLMTWMRVRTWAPLITFGSSSSSANTVKAELTAENRPACGCATSCGAGRSPVLGVEASVVQSHVLNDVPGRHTRW